MNANKRAFTLIELLTVIAVIGVLAAILIPTVGRARQSAYQAEAIANLREIHSAISMYVVNNNNQYPRSQTLKPEGATGSDWDYDGGFWFNTIAPYLEEGRRFNRQLVRTKGPWPQSIPFASPFITDKELHGWGGAGIDIGYNGHLFPRKVAGSARVRAVNIENPSRALLAVDAMNPNNGVGAWSVGSAGAFQPGRIAFRNNGQANVLFVDGSVTQITREDLDDPVFVKLLSGVNRR